MQTEKTDEEVTIMENARVANEVRLYECTRTSTLHDLKCNNMKTTLPTYFIIYTRYCEMANDVLIF